MKNGALKINPRDKTQSLGLKSSGAKHFFFRRFVVEWRCRDVQRTVYS